MGTLRRTLSAVITAAILLGAVVLVIILSRAAPAAPGEGVASAPQVTPAGYPAPPEPPEADAPPLPTAEPVATYTLPPIVQTADALMALPTETPLPTPTASPRPTQVPVLESPWRVAVLSGVDSSSGHPAIIRITVDEAGRAQGEPAVLDTGLLAGPRTGSVDMRPAPNGPRVVLTLSYGEGTSTAVLDVTTGEIEILFHGHEAAPLAWHPDGRRLLVQTFSAGRPDALRLLDVIRGEWQELPGPRKGSETWPVTSASFAPDGAEVALALSDEDSGGYRSEV
jgi:hypothetical protein